MKTNIQAKEYPKETMAHQFPDPDSLPAKAQHAKAKFRHCSLEILFAASARASRSFSMLLAARS
jgi:hypothetical protein